jgi:predicted O-linked N-acetylglucosamine transferase (SPINDLY family)
MNRDYLKKLQHAVELHASGRVEESTFFYEEILNECPTSVEVLELLASALLALKQFDRAESAAKQALKNGMDRTAAQKIIGIVAVGKGDYPNAALVLSDLLQSNPNDYDLLMNLGLAQRGMGDLPAAQKHLGDSIAVHDTGVARLNRGCIHLELRDYDAAKQDLHVALDLLPGDPEPLFYEGVRLLAVKAFREAILIFESSANAEFKKAESFFNISACLRELGNQYEAIKYLNLARNAGYTEYLIEYNIAFTFFKLGELSLALEHIESALTFKTDAESQLLKAEVLTALGDVDSAQCLLDRMEPTTSENCELRKDLLEAVLLTKSRRWSEGIAMAAAIVEKKPLEALAYFTLAFAQHEGYSLSNALENYKRAVEIDPAFVEAWNNLGAVYRQLGQFDDALKSLEVARKIDPENLSAIYNQAISLVQAKNKEKASQLFAELYVRNPKKKYVLGNLISTKMGLADWEGLEGLIDDLKRLIADGVACAPPFATLAVLNDGCLQRKATESFFSFKKSAPTELGSHDASGRKIKIGYFSADFFDHATAHLLSAVIEAHDRSKFEIYAFSFLPRKNDLYGSRISRAFDHFIDVSRMSDSELVSHSRQCGIDIAVDLKGHTLEGRPDIFLERLAPIQINFLGYPGTFGHSCMDFLIADSNVIPEGYEEFYAERVIRVDGCFQPSDDERKEYGRDLSQRAQWGLPESALVFCSFNGVYKITPDVFGIWCKILKSVGNSVLWLMCHDNGARNRLRDVAESHGVNVDRLVFADLVPIETHRARLPLADVALDTFPCGGHTTCNDLLWAGVPVLTVAGETFASRVAASLVRTMGLPELATTDVSAYAESAIKLGTDKQYLAEIRRRVSDPIGRQRLFDVAGYARKLETAYLQAITASDLRKTI